MARFAKQRRVFYWEEPLYDAPNTPGVELRTCPTTGVRIATPHLPPDAHVSTSSALRDLLAQFVASNKIENPIVWFYTPMALSFFPASIAPSVVIYDCMDELSMFHGAPPMLREMEAQLFAKADLVFTGGASLYEAKRRQHSRVSLFASGVDASHFVRARTTREQFAEHASIMGPRLGYAGVIDERIDLPLIDAIAEKRPDWQIVMIGPTAKIDPASLPSRPNIHWLGLKCYQDLPRYFSGWDVALMPFALNESTRFISPTKTPEYLWAGLPVVSTAIRDVVSPYGDLGFVQVANDAEQFVSAAEAAMAGGACPKWRERTDQFIGTLSWDSVWSGMNSLVEKCAFRQSDTSVPGLNAVTSAEHARV